MTEDKTARDHYLQHALVQDQHLPRPADEPETDLARYGQREAVRELADRCAAMLPSVADVGKAGALALAQVAISLGLNPLTGELWLIPRKDGTYSVFTGIKGLRRAARQQAEADNGYYDVRFRMPSEDEIEGLTRGEGDVLRAADLYVWTDRTRQTYQLTGKPTIFSGLGIYRAGEPTRMEPLQVARKRAEADALKQAFDLPVGFEGPEGADRNE